MKTYRLWILVVIAAILCGMCAVLLVEWHELNKKRTKISKFPVIEGYDGGGHNLLESRNIYTVEPPNTVNMSLARRLAPQTQEIFRWESEMDIIEEAASHVERDPTDLDPEQETRFSAFLIELETPQQINDSQNVHNPIVIDQLKTINDNLNNTNASQQREPSPVISEYDLNLPQKCLEICERIRDRDTFVHAYDISEGDLLSKVVNLCHEHGNKQLLIDALCGCVDDGGMLAGFDIVCPTGVASRLLQVSGQLNGIFVYSEQEIFDTLSNLLRDLVEKSNKHTSHNIMRREWKNIVDKEPFLSSLRDSKKQEIYGWVEHVLPDPDDSDKEEEQDVTSLSSFEDNTGENDNILDETVRNNGEVHHD